MENKYILQIKNVSKSFGEYKVLNNINLDFSPGEIHCLLGENGAGKSTLMNILFGMEVIHTTGGYEGEIEFDGKKENIKTPHRAMELGIGMVHQEFMLIPEFTITENIKLNREITKDSILSKAFGEKLKTIDFEQMSKDANNALNTIDMSIDEWIKVAGLPVGHMQFIEIAREIDKTKLKLLVFDEPTAVLTESEAKKLLDTMKKLAKTGIAIIFITHRLDEVIDVSDRVSILRDGELIKTIFTKDTTVEEIAELMVGRKVELTNKAKSDKNRETILELKDFSVDMPGELVKEIDLEIKKGEILGIGGLAGQGKIGIANGIVGMYPTKGKMILNGKEIPLNDTRVTLENRIAFVSEDRRGVGLVLDESIEMNVVFTALNINKEFLKNYGLFRLQDKRRIKKHTEKMIKDLDIRCTSSKQYTRRLSGGNQQKVCLARALTQEPDILLISEPTRGIDIGAKRLVLDLLLRLNEELEMTIVMTSSELSELRSICDRIIIVSEGRIIGSLMPDDDDVKFGLLMSGKTVENTKKGAEANG